MANTKISALGAVTPPASTDEFAVNQGGTTKKETRAQIHTLESGETLDTVSGVDLLLQRDGVTKITVASGVVTVADEIIVSGLGPHAIGVAIDDRVQLNIGGGFDAGATGGRAIAVAIATDLTGAAGQTDSLVLFDVGSALGASIRTQVATESIGVIATARFSEPNINDRLTGDITIAATISVVNAPTEGEVNAAVRIGTGSVVCQGAALATNATTGFLYIPTSAGAPSGTPEAHVGVVAMQFDTTNNDLYVYDGAWIKVAMAA